MAMLMRNQSLSDDNMQQVIISFCNHMWAICDMATKAHTPSEARASIRIINVEKQLFSLGLVVHVACPLQELFSVQHGRLMDIVSESIISGCDTEASDTASDVTDTREWEELVDDLGKLGETLKREDWCYDVVSKEWKPVDQ